MEYYTGEIKKELLPFATAKMELETTILSEIRQVVKNKYHTISLFKRNSEQNKLVSKTEPEA